MIKIIRFYTWLFFVPLVLVLYLSDKISQTLLGKKKDSSFMIKGSCKKRGVCCKTLGIELPKQFFNSERWKKRIWIPYYFWIHHFIYQETLQNTMIFSCGHLNPQGLCSIYPYRPRICREFPNNNSHHQKDLHEGCGFSIISTDPKVLH